MKATKLFFPGTYEDAYVYMGRLFILTEERSMLVYDLDKIAESLERAYPQTLPIPTLMFSRNDWLASAQFKSLMRNAGMLQSLLDALKEFPQPYLVEGRDFVLEEQELGIADPVILDMLIYSQRLYMGATNGFYRSDIVWGKNGSVTLKKPEKRFDDRCLNTSARYGTINASCSNAGLVTFVDDFGWWKHGESSTVLTLAETSLRTAWIDLDIVNYPGSDHPYLFKSSFEENKGGEEKEGKVLTHIERNSQDLGYLFEMAQTKYSISKETIQFAFNSNNRLFMQNDAGNLHSIQLDRSENNKIQLGKDRRTEEVLKRILTINPGKYGPVVETSDMITLVLDKSSQLFPLSDTGALMVRTFPRSRRFQNIVAITDDDGVALVSLFDESEFGSDAHADAIRFF